MLKVLSSASAAALFTLALCAPPAAASIVQNGSFETLEGPFHNTSFNYQQLGDGSTFLTGWTVTTSSGHLALAQSPTSDGHNASDQTYFVDLSGFSDESHDGAVSQTIHTTAGATYGVSIDLYNGDNGIILVTVGGNLVNLSAGSSVTVGNDTWTTFHGAFTGDGANLNPLLKIANGKPGSDIDFIDNVSIVQTGGGNSVAEPAAWALMILGFGGVGAMARRARPVLAY